MTTAVRNRTPLQTGLSKVPEITAYFWIVKVLATTVGETGADLLSATLGLGLRLTGLVMTVVLAGALALQFRSRRYVPTTYWVTVVLVSIVGTLLSDLLVDDLGVPLVVTAAAFAALLAVVFVQWWRSEGTLSIHAVDSPRREAWYWTAILATFALGTAGGDLVAEGLGLGYGVSAGLFALLIGAVWFGYRRGLGPVLAFWAAYVLTRPLGASLGDGLSQPRDVGGLGLGTIGTSALFLVVIVAVVAHLTRSRVDAPEGAQR